jgi:metal-responsive CopG/Arc/MetJ family transcriptional regulator
MAIVSSDIPPEWVEALDAQADESFSKRSQIIRQAIGNYLRQCGRLPIPTQISEPTEPEPIAV